MWVCAHEFGYPNRPEEGTGLLGAGVTVSNIIQYGCCELKGSSARTPGILTSESSLWLQEGLISQTLQFTLCFALLDMYIQNGKKDFQRKLCFESFAFWVTFSFQSLA